MSKFLIRRGFRVSIQMLLPLILMVGIFPSSAKYPSDSMNSSGLELIDNQTHNKSEEMTLVVTSAPAKEPIFLRYLIRLFGNDWLGADWMYLGLVNYRFPALYENGQQLYGTHPVTGVKTFQWKYARFWIDPGPALLKVNDTLWVWGYDAGSHTIYADDILVNPPARMVPPDDVNAYGKVLSISGQTITVQDSGGIRSTVTVDPFTTYSFPNGQGLPRPKDGLWLNISWLTGSAGLLGRYASFHGDYRGILRLDFTPP
jgi:hypothetical protein